MRSRTNIVRQNVLPVLAAMIWGTAFVAQSVSTEFVPPLAFTAARSAIAFLFLLVLCAVRRKVQKRILGEAYRPPVRRDLLVGGVCVGAALTVAGALQQKGIETISAGKSGFITTLYIVIVPIFGLFLGRRVPKLLWVSVALAVAGLYFLCMTEEFSIGLGDLLTLLCAFCFSVQIMLIDRFVQRVDGMELSCVQFFTVTVIALVGTLLFEKPTISGLIACILPLLYVGIFSSGVAYTLQILAQKDSNPAVVSLLLSLEAVFATLSGALLLHETMAAREYFGCALMLAAVLLAQLPERQAA